MTVLYRKYRPQKLSEIIGQDHIKEALLKQLASGKIHHAYLFTGPKGTGKTSTARILSKALNCQAASSKQQVFGEPCNKCESCKAMTDGRHLDLIEIDAASNRGIDDIRELREKIRLSPSSARFKVYIIDEAHMLTGEAFNALLKTLEEPPEHAIFILATTEAHKLPGTILSRVQRFNFERPTIEKIKEKLKAIIKEEKWKIEDSGVEEIARAAGGAFRDAEVLLEKVAGVNPSATRGEVLESIGKKDLSSVLEIIQIIENKNAKEAMLWLDEFVKGGGNVRVLNETILDILRKILLIKVEVGEELVKKEAVETYINLKNLSDGMGSDRIRGLINLFSRSIEELAMATIPELPLELALIEACEFSSVGPKDHQVSNKADEDPKPAETKQKEVDPPQKAPQVSASIDEKKILEKVKKRWPSILKALRDENKSLEFFLRGAQPQSIEEGKLILKFYYRFHKDRVEDPKNRGIIEQVLEKELGSPIKVKGILGAKPKSKVNTQLVEQVKNEADPAEIFGKID